MIISFFADPLSRKDQQNKSALRQRAERKEHGAKSMEQRSEIGAESKDLKGLRSVS